MREERFRTWLENGGGGCRAGATSIKIYIGDLRRIEHNQKIDLDTEFKRDGLVKLHQRGATTTLTSGKSRIKQYQKFCTEHPPSQIDLDMRLDDFKIWLSSPKYGLNIRLDLPTTRAALMSLYDIERAEKIDLDKEFDRDGLESLLELYTYTEQDERDGRPNRTKILDESSIKYNEALSLSDKLSLYKNSISGYRKFRLEYTSDESTNN